MGITASRKSVAISGTSRRGGNAEETGSVVGAEIKQKEAGSPVKPETMNGKSGEKEEKEGAPKITVDTPAKSTETEVDDSAAKDTTTVENDKENSEKSEKGKKEKKEKVKKKMSFRSISFLKRKHKEKPSKNGDVPADDANKSTDNVEDKAADVTAEAPEKTEKQEVTEKAPEKKEEAAVQESVPAESTEKTTEIAEAVATEPVEEETADAAPVAEAPVKEEPATEEKEEAPATEEIEAPAAEEVPAAVEEPAKSDTEAEVEPETSTEVEAAPVSKAEVAPEPEPESKPEAEAAPEPESNTGAEAAPEPEPKTEAEPESQPEESNEPAVEKEEPVEDQHLEIEPNSTSDAVEDEAIFHEALSRTSSQDFLSCDDLDENDVGSCDFEPSFLHSLSPNDVACLNDELSIGQREENSEPPENGFFDVPPPILDEFMEETAEICCVSPPGLITALLDVPELPLWTEEVHEEVVEESAAFVRVDCPPAILAEACMQTSPEPLVDRMVSPIALEKQEFVEVSIQTSPEPPSDRIVSLQFQEKTEKLMELEQQLEGEDFAAEQESVDFAGNEGDENMESEGADAEGLEVGENVLEDLEERLKAVDVAKCVSQEAECGVMNFPAEEVLEASCDLATPPNVELSSTLVKSESTTLLDSGIHETLAAEVTVDEDVVADVAEAEDVAADVAGVEDFPASGADSKTIDPNGEIDDIADVAADSVAEAEGVAADVVAAEEVADEAEFHVAPDVVPAEDVAPDVVAAEDVAPDVVAAEDVAPDVVAAEDVAPDVVAAEDVVAEGVAADVVAAEEVAAEAVDVPTEAEDVPTEAEDIAVDVPTEAEDVAADLPTEVEDVSSDVAVLDSVATDVDVAVAENVETDEAAVAAGVGEKFASDSAVNVEESNAAFVSKAEAVTETTQACPSTSSKMPPSADEQNGEVASVNDPKNEDENGSFHEDQEVSRDMLSCSPVDSRSSEVEEESRVNVTVHCRSDPVVSEHTYDNTCQTVETFSGSLKEHRSTEETVVQLVRAEPAVILDLDDNLQPEEDPVEPIVDASEALEHVLLTVEDEDHPIKLAEQLELEGVTSHVDDSLVENITSEDRKSPGEELQESAEPDGVEFVEKVEQSENDPVVRVSRHATEKTYVTDEEHAIDNGKTSKNTEEETNVEPSVLSDILEESSVSHEPDTRRRITVDPDLFTVSSSEVESNADTIFETSSMFSDEMSEVSSPVPPGSISPSEAGFEAEALYTSELFVTLREAQRKRKGDDLFDVSDERAESSVSMVSDSRPGNKKFQLEHMTTIPKAFLTQVFLDHDQVMEIAEENLRAEAEKIEEETKAEEEPAASAVEEEKAEAEQTAEPEQQDEKPAEEDVAATSANPPSDPPPPPPEDDA